MVICIYQNWGRLFGYFNTSDWSDSEKSNSKVVKYFEELFSIINDLHPRWTVEYHIGIFLMNIWKEGHDYNISDVRNIVQTLQEFGFEIKFPTPYPEKYQEMMKELITV